MLEDPPDPRSRGALARPAAPGMTWPGPPPYLMTGLILCHQ
jgi:hypothetical protein